MECRPIIIASTTLVIVKFFQVQTDEKEFLPTT